MGAMLVLTKWFRKCFHGLLLTLCGRGRRREKKKKHIKFSTFLPLLSGPALATATTRLFLTPPTANNWRLDRHDVFLTLN
jgi:hypothetical protein